jgi:hypothetical protein
MGLKESNLEKRKKIGELELRDRAGLELFELESPSPLKPKPSPGLSAQVRPAHH